MTNSYVINVVGSFGSGNAATKTTHHIRKTNESPVISTRGRNLNNFTGHPCKNILKFMKTDQQNFLMTRLKPEQNESFEVEKNELRELVVHNDDFNTFDFVIKTLIEVCKHKPEQAEQCTMIIHHKGKCAVKSGDYDELKPMYQEILNRGITATIE